MSSACESRDFNPSGSVPTIERNYPAVVLYTFIPARKNSSEIFVSEGDIVQLLYSVGGWVFIRTYEGTTGYIPLEYVGDLESSLNLRSVFDEKGENYLTNWRCKFDRTLSEICPRDGPKLPPGSDFVTRDSVFITEGPSLAKGERSVLDWNSNVRDGNKAINRDLKRHHSSENPQGYTSSSIDENHFVYSAPTSRARDERGVGRNLDACAICSAFLSKFIAGVQNLAITDRGKADLKSQKLLKLLKKVAQDGLNLVPPSKDLTNHIQSHSLQIKQKCIRNFRDPSCDQIPEFSENCNQCRIFKDFFEVAKKYSMTDLYATIRDLHINAISDSDSEGEADLQKRDGGDGEKTPCASSVDGWAKRHSSGDMQHLVTGSIKLTGNSSPEIKRSMSFQMEQSTRNKSDILRNNSFSGRTSSDNSNVPTIRDLLPLDDIASDYSTPRNSASTAGRSSDTTGDVTSPGFNSRMPSIHSDEGYSSTDTGSTNPGLPDMFADTVPCLVLDSSNDNGACENMNDLIQLDDDDNNNTSQKSQGSKPSGVYGFQSLITSSLPLSPRASPSKSPSFLGSLKRGEVLKFTGSSQQKEQGTGAGAELAPRVQTGIKHVPSRTSFSKQLAERNKSISDNIQPKSSQKLDLSPERTRQGSMHLQFSPPPIPGSECEASGHVTVPVIRGLQKPENDAGRRIIARRFQSSYRNPMDLRNSSGALSTDKDIRKTLHDLNSGAKRTTSLKNTPMRAQHSIPVQNPPREGTGVTGKAVPTKKFNKQIWRPSQGMPEGSDQRPFSPFGGTLPPSKITKKKVVEVFV